MSHFERTMSIATRAGTGYQLETVCPAADLGGSNGIAIGPDGRLWICEAQMQRVTACDTTTGALETIIAREDNVLIAPDDLAFDSDGSCYITDSTRITVRRPDGQVSILGTGLSGANGITVDSDDRLFVNEFRPGGRILEVDRYSGELRLIVEALDFPNACMRGTDGRLYVQSVLAGTILAVDVETGSMEEVASGFQQPPSVRIGPSGLLYVAEAMRGCVTEMDLRTGSRRVVATMPLAGVDNFNFDATGAMYVSSYATGCILKYPTVGAEPEVLVPPGLVSILGIGPTAGDGVLVANAFSIPLVGEDGEMEMWSSWTPSAAGQFVTGVCGRRDGKAYVLVDGGHVFLVEHGQTAHAFFLEDDTVSGAVAADVQALAPIESGVLLATSDGRIAELREDGTTRARGQLPLNRFTALAGTAEVIGGADAEANRVAVATDGEVTVLDDFARPTGVAIVGRHLYVAEHSARRVSRHDLDTGATEVVAVDLPFGWPVPQPPPVGVASLIPDGANGILIGCDGDGSIRRLTPSTELQDQEGHAPLGPAPSPDRC